jgi:hypothetical protein
MAYEPMIIIPYVFDTVQNRNIPELPFATTYSIAGGLLATGGWQDDGCPLTPPPVIRHKNQVSWQVDIQEHFRERRDVSRYECQTVRGNNSESERVTTYLYAQPVHSLSKKPLRTAREVSDEAT